MFQTVYPEFVRINDAVMRDTRRIAEIGMTASPLLSVAVLANVLREINQPETGRCWVPPVPAQSKS